jgi:RNA polymerase sigma-70 factor, ECF subfamily
MGVPQREEAILKPTREVNPTELPDGVPSSPRTWFDCEESNLLRFAYSLTGRREVAEEIVQEVFLKLHSKWNDVREPRAWLYRSVRNRAYHHLRKSRRETQLGDEDSGFDLEGDPIGSPEQLMAHAESVLELRRLLAELPEKDRKLVHMKYFEDLKYREISEQTGLTISNVGFRLHQVLKKLATSLQLRGVEEPS